MARFERLLFQEPAADFSLGLGVAVLAQLPVGDAGKIAGLGALGQPAVSVGHGNKLAVGLLCVVARRVNAGPRWSAGLSQGPVIDIQSRAQSQATADERTFQ